MNIKNYTSEIDPSKSMANIEKWLVEIGASNINKNYADKVCTGITFLYFDLQLKQTVAFHLKAQVKECFEIFWKTFCMDAQLIRINYEKELRENLKES